MDGYYRMSYGRPPYGVELEPDWSCEPTHFCGPAVVRGPDGHLERYVVQTEAYIEQVHPLECIYGQLQRPMGPAHNSPAHDSPPEVKEFIGRNQAEASQPTMFFATSPRDTTWGQEPHLASQTGMSRPSRFIIPLSGPGDNPNSASYKSNQPHGSIPLLEPKVGSMIGNRRGSLCLPRPEVGTMTLTSGTKVMQ